MDQYHKLFPALKTCIYADTAAAGLMYDELLQWRQDQDLDLLLQASAMWPSKISILKDTRSAIKRFFKVRDADVALVPNFSIGLNLLLEDQDTSQKVLLIEDDYPSVNWPFENRGFPITYVKPDSQMEEHIAEEVQSQNISILALSLVQWLNGVKIDMNFLKQLKQAHPDLLIIADGTQHCGAFSVDMADSGIDVLGASGYKWLLGGYGNGFILVKNRSFGRFQHRSVGFNSAGGILDNRDQVSFCKRLEPGHLDSLSFGSLCRSLELLEQIGMDKIEVKNKRLSQYAISAFRQLGILEENILQRSEHGCIFRLVADRSLFEHLLANNVRCSWRSDAIRMSFHFYNTEKEIDRIVEIIKMAV